MRTRNFTDTQRYRQNYTERFVNIHDAGLSHLWQCRTQLRRMSALTPAIQR
jgi:hypothetical protein